MARAERTHDGSFSLGYLPQLDGIRAVAVLAVMAFHVDVFFTPRNSSNLSGGFLGVDVFFALSGFLITTILAEEWSRRKRVDLPAFYARRALRLFPAVFVVLVSVFAYAGAVLNSSAADFVKRQALWTLLYVQNWHIIDTKPTLLVHLDHTWSLSVEEQFYFVWPLLLLGIFAMSRSVRSWVGIVLIGAAVSALALVLIAPSDPFLAFYGTVTRAQGLLLGAALGLAAVFGKLSRPDQRLARSAGSLGASVLLVLFVFGNDDSSNYWFIVAASLASVALIFGVVCAPTTLLARSLSRRVPVAIGRISYGLYLWHLPIFLVVTPHDTDFTLWNTGLSFWPLLVVRFALTFVVAGASFALVERPALRLKRRFERRPDHAVPPEHAVP